jgi:septum formation protein
MNPLNLILASASPRRRRFLQDLGLPHKVIPADIDEEPKPNEDAPMLAARLAASKATLVAGQLATDDIPAIVIGADTVVAIGDTLLGKPIDEDDAINMLRRLRREQHQVHSALALVRVEPDGIRCQQVQVNTTNVTMRAYTDEEIVAYVASGDSLDKAGGYAIQHREFEPVAGLAGCPAGVMGMPLADLCAMLATLGIAVDHPLPPICRQLTGLPCCQEGAICSELC